MRSPQLWLQLETKMMKTAGFLALLALVANAKAQGYDAPDTSSQDPFSTCPKPDSIKDGTSCLDVIRLMAKCDRCLDTRQDQKKKAAKMAASPEEFLKLMKGQKCNGTQYNCGNTRSYVTEIFEGLPAHYEESKYDDGTEEGATKSQNLKYTSASLRAHFEIQASNPNTIIYHMRHTGTHDHVWTVEQLSKGQGYRVYQSYHDGYSLLAWLSEGDPEKLFRPDDGDLMIWRSVQNSMDMALKMMTNGSASISNVMAAKDDPKIKPLLPFGSYVASYDKGQTLTNFKTSWDQYGKGQVISKDAFLGNDTNSYLSKMISMMAYMEQHGNNDSTPYARPPWDNWIALYASPDPQYYPGLPNNAVSSLTQAKGATYSLQLKTVEIKEGEPQCAKNTRVILGE